MRQKCVRNASKWVLFYWEKRNVQNASELRQKCVKSARNTFGGEHLLDDTDFGPGAHLPAVLLLHYCSHSLSGVGWRWPAPSAGMDWTLKTPTSLKGESRPVSGESIGQSHQTKALTKNCQKSVPKSVCVCVSDNFWKIIGQLLDSFLDTLSTFHVSVLSNDVPVTSLGRFCGL